MAQQAFTRQELEDRARKVWRRQYPNTPWPSGWQVLFAQHGYTDFHCKEIVILGDLPEDQLDTLTHEFAHLHDHLKGKKSRHNKRFWRKVRRKLRRVVRL